MSKSTSLEGKRALIVGGSSGIGLACAEAFLADGAAVTLAGRGAEALEAAAAGLDGAVSWTVCDAMDAASVQAAVTTAEGSGGLHISVSIPGGGNYSPVLGYDDEDFMAQVANNLRPAFLVLKYSGLAMVRAGGGSVVLISSTASVLSTPYLAAYCAGKAAVDQLARVAADELGRSKVRVNTVRPGLTRTGATEGMFGMDETLGAFREQQPLERHGSPEDIGRAVRFLAGTESSWVTGQCLTVDGGHTLRRFPDMEPLARAVVGDAVFDATRRGALS